MNIRKQPTNCLNKRLRQYNNSNRSGCKWFFFRWKRQNPAWQRLQSVSGEKTIAERCNAHSSSCQKIVSSHCEEQAKEKQRFVQRAFSVEKYVLKEIGKFSNDIKELNAVKWNGVYNFLSKWYFQISWKYQF